MTISSHAATRSEVMPDPWKALLGQDFIDKNVARTDTPKLCCSLTFSLSLVRRCRQPGVVEVGGRYTIASPSPTMTTSLFIPCFCW